MKKTMLKKWCAFVLAIIAVLSIMAISVWAAEHTYSYNYTLENGWEDTIIINYESAMGFVDCGYKNGALSAPKTTTKTVGYGECHMVATSSYIIDGSGNKYEDTIYGTYSTDELVVKAGFFDSPSKTWHYGYIAGPFEDAAGIYIGNK